MTIWKWQFDLVWMRTKKKKNIDKRPLQWEIENNPLNDSLIEIWLMIRIKLMGYFSSKNFHFVLIPIYQKMLIGSTQKMLSIECHLPMHGIESLNWSKTSQMVVWKIPHGVAASMRFGCSVWIIYRRTAIVSETPYRLQCFVILCDT